MPGKGVRALERLQVSRDGHFLETASGRPFFWLGDTAWELFHRLKREEVAQYLDHRQAKRFNLIQAVALAEFDGLTLPNVYGDLPLLGLDPTRPNPAYFDFVDEVIRAAADRGLYLGLLPTWGDKVTPMWGTGPAVFTPENARIYGRWLGQRYRETDQPGVDHWRRPPGGHAGGRLSPDLAHAWQRVSAKALADRP